MSRLSIRQQAEQLLATGIATIKQEFDLPQQFPAEVVAQVELAKPGMRNPTSWLGGARVDRTQIPFVTLDPAESTDLDQAFHLEKLQDDIVLYYALADVAAFVPAESGLEREAWNRGVTLYGLADKIPLYPREISQQAASLLPDGPRPTMLITVAIDPSGQLRLINIQRAICRSRAKLDYATVDVSRIDHLEEFAQRMFDSEAKRGALRFYFPEQEVVADSSAPGGVRLDVRAPVLSERVNAALSLAVNMAIAKLFMQAETGLFRVMPEPEAKSLKRLKYEAHALGIGWLETESLRDLLGRLQPDNLIHRRFMLTVRRAGGRANYATYSNQPSPWHFAISAPYVHATAPMRRLADRYVLEAAYRLHHRLTIPTERSLQLSLLPKVMARCEGRARSVSGAIIDLLEAVSLQSRLGEILKAEVVDASAKIVQTLDSAIRSRAANLPAVNDGDIIRVRIDQADPVKRKVLLTAVTDSDLSNYQH